MKTPQSRTARSVTWLFGLVFILMAGSESAAADRLRIGGTGATYGLMQVLAKEFQKTYPDVEFEFPPSLGSSGGVKALKAGAIDLATTSRPLKAKERAAGAEAIAFSKTALAVVTSRSGIEKGVTRSDLVALFGLQRTTWPDGSRVRPVLRPKSESDARKLVQEIPGMGPALDAAHEIGSIPVANTDQMNLDFAEKLPGSIAVSGLSAVLSEGRKVSVLNLDGVAPTPENVASGSYALTKTLYLVLGPHSPQLVRDFAAFVRSPAGAGILHENGCLPVS